MNIETHDEITSFEILRLIEKVGADCVGVVFDTANGLQRGEHPVFAAKRLAPHIRQTHIKDAYVGRALVVSISRPDPLAAASSISPRSFPFLRTPTRR